MTKMIFIRNIKDIQFLIIVFLGMFIFGSFVQGLTKIKYIGLYGAIVFYLIDIIKNKIFLYKQYFLENKSLFISLFLFLFSIVLSIIFSFSDSIASIKEFETEFLNTFIFIIIALNIKDKRLMIKILFYMIILAFVYDTIIYAYIYIKNNPSLNLSIRLERNYSDYFLIIYPFILSSFFIFNNIKYFNLILLLIGFIELILTGARGAWVGVFGETIIFIVFLAYLKEEYIKRIVLSVGIISLVLIGSGYYLYKHSFLVKNRIDIGIFYLSGRDEIVKTRFPIFLKHENLIFGIGGPDNYQYNKFLNFYHAPVINNETKRIVKGKIIFDYYVDEPFLLQIFYKEGIFGLITFLFFIIIFLYQSYKSLNIYVLSIITSFIGYFLIRGLVEGRELKFLLIYVALFLIAKDKNENSIHLS